jgi:hypothetical protein
MVLSRAGRKLVHQGRGGPGIGNEEAIDDQWRNLKFDDLFREPRVASEAGRQKARRRYVCGLKNILLH